MNIIETICEALGIQIGEEFALTGTGNANFDTSLRFRPDGLEKLEGNEWSKAPSFYLAGIVYGNFKVVKLPYEPIPGQIYYYLSLPEKKILKEIYSGRTFDLLNGYCGNRFRTVEEGETKKREVYERLTGEEWTYDAKTDKQGR